MCSSQGLSFIIWSYNNLCSNCSSTLQYHSISHPSTRRHRRELKADGAELSCLIIHKHQSELGGSFEWLDEPPGRPSGVHSFSDVTASAWLEGHRPYAHPPFTIHLRPLEMPKCGPTLCFCWAVLWACISKHFVVVARHLLSSVDKSAHSIGRCTRRGRGTGWTAF